MKGYPVGSGGEGNLSDSCRNPLVFWRRGFQIAAFSVAVLILCVILYNSAYPSQFLPRSYYSDEFSSSVARSKVRFAALGGDDLDRVLRRASMADNTVIITTMNKAWAAPNSLMDVFMESFHIGNRTGKLLNHLVIVALDQEAYARCSAKHSHCYALETDGVNFANGEAYFMTPDYLKLMWRRIEFLTSVLEKGYSFVFTDADIVWFRDPFPHFYPDADFQIACDQYIGNSSDFKNRPNGGLNYARSNDRTLKFYKFWYSSREKHPGLHDQDVLNKIKNDPYISDIGVRIKFLDTAYFGGFCEPSKDLNVVCTMHANCCFGLESKIKDLKIIQDDWKNYISSVKERNSSWLSWSAPRHCSLDDFHPPNANQEGQK